MNNGNVDINLGNIFVFVVGIFRIDVVVIVNNSCIGVLVLGVSCDVEFSYNIIEYKQSYVKLIIGLSIYKMGVVYVYFYFDVLDVVFLEIVSFLVNLFVYNIYVNDYFWMVVGNGLQILVLLVGEEFVILLENLF